MKRLQGAAKRAHVRKVEREVKRSKEIDHKRDAIARMQESHSIVKKMRKLDILAHNSKCIVEVAYNASKIALYSAPCIVLLTLTVKVFFWIVNL